MTVDCKCIAGLNYYQIENPNRYAVTTLEVSRGGIYDADIQFLQGPSVNDVSALRWEKGGWLKKKMQ